MPVSGKDQVARSYVHEIPLSCVCMCVRVCTRTHARARMHMHICGSTEPNPSMRLYTLVWGQHGEGRERRLRREKNVAGDETGKEKVKGTGDKGR